ncbi:MAG: hypothetical protein ACRDOP_11180 [Gaiellaceae bacterium]
MDADDDADEVEAVVERHQMDWRDRHHRHHHEVGDAENEEGEPCAAQPRPQLPS